MSSRALVVATLGVAAALAWGATGGAAGKPRLAVLEFRPAGTAKELESLGSGLQSMLTTDLSQVEGVTLVERARLHDVQGELKLSRTAAVDPATAARAGKLAGASHIVVGTFTVVGKKLRLDSRLVEVATGKVALATSVDGEQDAFFELEKTLVNRLLGGIGVTLSAKERGAVARIHTTDFEAFRRFSAGVQLFDDARYEEALAQLRAAAQKDEDFKLARVTLEEYERLAASLRNQATDVEVAKAEVQRLEREGQAAKENAVLRKLFEVAGSRGKEASRRRVAALWLLTTHYGRERRGRDPLVDRFAAERTADGLAQRYWAEAPALWPHAPALVNHAMTNGPRLPDAAGEVDKELDGAVARLDTWEVPENSPQNADHYRNLLTSYRLGTLETGIEEFARRLHLDLRGEAELRDRLYDLALKLLPSLEWKKAALRKRAESRRALLDLDASTRLLASMRALDKEADWLRFLANQIEENGKLAKALAGVPRDSPLREHVLLSGAQEWSLRNDFKDGQLTPMAAYRLTEARKLQPEQFLLVGDMPAWTIGASDLFSGPRRDPRRTDEVRYYLEPGYKDLRPRLLMIDGVPRRDLQASFQVDFLPPRDFWPRSPSRGDTFESHRLEPGQARLTVLLRAQDVERDDAYEPVTNKPVPHPVKAAAVIIGADRVQLATVEIVRGRDWMNSPEPVVKVLAERKAALSGTVPVTVKARGGRLEAQVGSVSLSAAVPEGEGFLGFAFRGNGYLAVRKIGVGR
ncbi:MAG TPA: CsgG/HfaB family protein [Polyangia bacterium]|nr:CsgG/HfaB family protein [Polyangia bacterium]